MRCVVAAIGSRGDVEPFAYLAETLARRGHEVVLALDAGHAPVATGATFAPLGGLDGAAMAKIVRSALAAPTPLARSQVAFRGFIRDRRAALVERLTDLAHQARDLIVVAEPLVFRRAGGLAWPTKTAVVVHVPSPVRDFVALDDLPLLRLVALSEAFAPPELRASAWHHCGFFVRPATTAGLAPHVAAFLAAGAAPMLLTMGSMTGFDGAALVAAFVAAARRVGRRAIIQRGWANLTAPAADDVLGVDEADYAALFPRCAAVFTHGGTGTVAHALRAGRPIGCLPLVWDQVAWAGCLVATGSGLGAIDPVRPDEASLVAMMRRAIDDPALGGVAAALAARLVAEDGVGTAAAHLEAYA